MDTKVDNPCHYCLGEELLDKRTSGHRELDMCLIVLTGRTHAIAARTTLVVLHGRTADTSSRAGFLGRTEIATLTNCWTKVRHTNKGQMGHFTYAFVGHTPVATSSPYRRIVH